MVQIPNTDHWKLVASDSSNDLIGVKKYVSQKTGLKVVHGDVGGPLVNGSYSYCSKNFEHFD